MKLLINILFNLIIIQTICLVVANDGLCITTVNGRIVIVACPTTHTTTTTTTITTTEINTETNTETTTTSATMTNSIPTASSTNTPSTNTPLTVGKSTGTAKTVKLITSQKPMEPTNNSTIRMLTESPKNSPSYRTEDNFYSQINELNQALDEKGLDSDRLIGISGKLAELLHNETQQMNEQKLVKCMETIEKIEKHWNSQQISDKSDNKTVLIRNSIESYSYLLDEEQAWNNLSTTMKLNYSSNILKYIQESGYKLACHKNGQEHTKNIAIESVSIRDQHKIKINNSGSGFYIAEPNDLPEIDRQPGCERDIGISYLVKKLSNYMQDYLEEKQSIISNIIAFSLNNSTETVKLDKSRVNIILEHNYPLMFGDRIECIYWDFQQMNWSSNGCQFQIHRSDRKFSICECNHLTNFAVLMDCSGREDKSEMKDILTKVCCGLSIVCLMITIGFLIMKPVIKNLKLKTRVKITSLFSRNENITINLCFCLLIMNLLVVFGLDSTDDNIMCKSIACVLLYFTLCSFSWMLMEGYEALRKFVLIFPQKGYLDLMKLYLIGYAVPLLVTVFTIMAIETQEFKYTGSYFCWISSASHPSRIWSVLGPAIVAFSANIIIIVLVMKTTFQQKSLNRNNSTRIRPQNISDRLSWIKGFISQISLLGITWTSFVLHIHEFGIHFSYCFIILNGLQGVFIFISQIILKKQEKNERKIQSNRNRNFCSVGEQISRTPHTSR